MKKLWLKVKCFFGKHEFVNKYGLGEWTEVNRCKNCGLFEEKDKLLNNVRYYYHNG